MADLPLDSELDKFAHLLQRRYGVDLSHYGRDFLERRLARRLKHWSVKSYLDYSVVLNRHPEEQRKLLEELSINVTEFFRDTAVYEALERRALPELLDGRGAAGELRAWSAGCATGEEAYTLSMVLHRFLRARRPDFPYSVHATDVNARSISHARQGVYSHEATAKVPAAYERYLDRRADGRAVLPAAKDPVRFAKHDLTALKEMPIVDLILCRNVLIYMSSASREQLMEFFHRTLTPGGFLVLGSLESLSRPELFVPFDAPHNIYKKIV